MQSTVLEKHASLLLQTSFFPCVFFIQHCLKIMTTQIWVEFWHINLIYAAEFIVDILFA